MISQLKNKVRKILEIRPRDTALTAQLKTEFTHGSRSFFHRYWKRFSDCLYCHASPGVLETVAEQLAAHRRERAGTQRLLNLGGGTGQVARLFERLGFEVTNVDLDIDPAQETGRNFRFDLNSPTPLSMADKFDVVICQEIIEHLENPWQLLRLAADSLAPGGMIILTTPNILQSGSRLRFFLTGYFHWFTPSAFSYHINPLPHWEIELIADRLNLDIRHLTGNGEFIFGRQGRNKKQILRDNEELIFTLTKKT